MMFLNAGYELPVGRWSKAPLGTRYVHDRPEPR